jgi:hypothetical protein
MNAANHTVLGISRSHLAIAMLGGVLLGVLYTVSPLTPWFIFGCFWLCRRAIRDLSRDERQIVLALFVIATVLRVAVVGGLFLITDHSTTPFGSLFGDEEYYKRRSLWLRSMALDVDISNADRRYAIDEYSDTSYLYILAFLQILVGSAPYGLHLFSIFLYQAGAVLMYRFVRRTYGSAPALLSFAGVLFVPTLFFWSLSVLRESLHFLVVTLVVVSVVEATRASTLRHRARWVLFGVTGLLIARDLRAGTMAVLMASAAAGLGAAWALRTQRRLAIALLVCAVIVGGVMSRAPMQSRLLHWVRAYASNHQGHVFTPGVHYKLLEPRFYIDRSLRGTQDMTTAEATRFVLRAIVAAVVVPVPWKAESTFTRAYLPEHIIWYVMVVLVPLGIWFGVAQSPPATLVMTSYVLLMGLGVALRSGNVGTLVRHRGLILPFVIVLSAVAACHLIARAWAATKTIADGSDTRANADFTDFSDATQISATSSLGSPAAEGGWRGRRVRGDE